MDLVAKAAKVINTLALGFLFAAVAGAGSPAVRRRETMEPRARRCRLSRF